MTERRLVSIWLPHFAMERWTKAALRTKSAPPAELPLVLAAEGPHGPVVHALNPAARTLGLRDGARVVDMQALCPGLLVRDAEPEADARALDRLAHWARRWCPWSIVDGADGLMLDTTGSDHLWGGEAAMLADIEARFADLGLHARPAIAPTRGAAWALARFGNAADRICHTADMERATAPLPVEALRIDPETVLLLGRLGLKSVGRLAQIPRSALLRRFRADGADLPARLDQLTGRLSEPLAPPEDMRRIRARLRLPEPVEDPYPHLPALAEDLCRTLAHEGLGLRRMRLEVYRVDGEVRNVELACARASRSVDHLLRLFKGRLDDLDPGFGFDHMALEAIATETVSVVQHDLDGNQAINLELSETVDRIVARLGRGAVARLDLRESHVPERAAVAVTALSTPPSDVPPAPVDRPIRLLDPAEEVRVLYDLPEGPPAQFVWRRQTFRVARQQGPERIAPEWWRDRPGTRLRDYFKVEVSDGRRFWLYREGALDDRRGGAPRWFLHGVFA